MELDQRWLRVCIFKLQTGKEEVPPQCIATRFVYCTVTYALL